MRAKITKRLLNSLKAPESGEVKIWDSELRGFVVRIRAGGSRRFIVEWMRDRQTRRLTLGEYGPLTSEQARDRARQVLAQVARGEDPAADRAAERAAPTWPTSPSDTLSSMRERFLSTAEIARLGTVLADEEHKEPFVVLAIRLLLLTGARRDEVLTLRWSDVDFERGALRLPDSKTAPR